MRIAFVNPQGNFDPTDSHLAAHPDFGGQLVYVRETALALAAMGHEADILTRRMVDPAWPEFSESRDAYPDQPAVRILRFPCGPDRFLPKEELWPYLAEWVENIARWYQAEGGWPDLWTGHYADGGLAAALLEEHSGVPFTFTAHSLGACKLDRLLQPDSSLVAAELTPGELLPALDSHYHFGARIAAERAASARAAVIIASSVREQSCSYSHSAYLGAVDARDHRRFAVIPPGVDLAIFDADSRSPREAELRETISAALDRDITPDRRHLPAVIAWSRLEPKKNHMALVLAFAHRPELREHANLIMITRGLDDPLRSLQTGSNIEQAVLRPLVAEIERAKLWGVVSAFSLAGQDAAAALYRWGASSGGVFCLPAKYEPFGLSLIEAMAAGLPVVATSSGGPPEITDGGRFGYLADPDDPGDLATQLLRLILDREEWQRLAVTGRERVLQCYSWQRTAEGYAGLAEEILRGERKGDPTFPLPDFSRGTGSIQLPQLTDWVMADLAPGEYCS